MALPLVDQFQVSDATGVVQLTWRPTLPNAPAAYRVYKSEDDGQTWTLQDDVVHDRADPALYDKTRSVFYLDDVLGAAGHIYRAHTIFGVLESKPVFAVVVPDPNITTIYGTIVNVDGAALAGADRTVHIEYSGDTFVTTTPDAAGLRRTNVGAAGRLVTVTANAQGVWQARLISGARVRVRVPAIGYDRVVQVPDTEGLFNLVDLVTIDQLPDKGRSIDSP